MPWEEQLCEVCVNRLTLVAQVIAADVERRLPSGTVDMRLLFVREAIQYFCVRGMSQCSSNPAFSIGGGGIPARYNAQYSLFVIPNDVFIAVMHSFFEDLRQSAPPDMVVYQRSINDQVTEHLDRWRTSNPDDQPSHAVALDAFVAVLYWCVEPLCTKQLGPSSERGTFSLFRLMDKTLAGLQRRMAERFKKKEHGRNVINIPRPCSALEISTPPVVLSSEVNSVSRARIRNIHNALNESLKHNVEGTVSSILNAQDGIGRAQPRGPPPPLDLSHGTVRTRPISAGSFRQTLVPDTARKRWITKRGEEVDQLMERLDVTREKMKKACSSASSSTATNRSRLQQSSIPSILEAVAQEEKDSLKILNRCQHEVEVEQRRFQQNAATLEQQYIANAALRKKRLIDDLSVADVQWTSRIHHGEKEDKHLQQQQQSVSDSVVSSDVINTARPHGKSEVSGLVVCHPAPSPPHNNGVSISPTRRSKSPPIESSSELDRSIQNCIEHCIGSKYPVDNGDDARLSGYVSKHKNYMARRIACIIKEDSRLEAAKFGTTWRKNRLQTSPLRQQRRPHSSSNCTAAAGLDSSLSATRVDELIAVAASPSVKNMKGRWKELVGRSNVTDPSRHSLPQPKVSPLDIHPLGMDDFVDISWKLETL